MHIIFYIFVVPLLGCYCIHPRDFCCYFAFFTKLQNRLCSLPHTFYIVFFVKRKLSETKNKREKKARGSAYFHKSAVYIFHEVKCAPSVSTTFFLVLPVSGVAPGNLFVCTYTFFAKTLLPVQFTESNPNMDQMWIIMMT